MSLLLRKKCVCLSLSALVLAACSANPAKKSAAFLMSGERSEKAGQFQEAAVQFRNAIEADPRSANAHYRLALVYIRMSAYQLAYSELLTTVKLDAGNKDAQLELATLLIGTHKFEDAQAAVTKVLTSDPNNARAHTLLGAKHAALQAWPMAIGEFQESIRLDPCGVDSYTGLALAYSATNRLPQAEESLQKATELCPKSFAAHLNLGRFYLAQHRLSEAEKALRAAFAADTRTALPFALMAKAYFDNGRSTDTARICAELKSLAPRNPDAYQALAEFYEGAGQKDQAIAELKSAMTVNPNDGNLKAHLSELLLDLGRIDEAARLNQDLLNSQPADPRALLIKGRILIAQQKPTEAKATLEQSVRSDPQSATAHYLLGTTYSLLGLSQSARASLLRAHEISPGMVAATVALAELNFKNGDYESALSLANEVPRGNSASFMASVLAAKILMAKGDVLEAETRLRPALDRDPAYLPALGVLLDLQAKQGRSQETIDRISALVAHYPDKSGLYLLLSLAYLKKNNLDDAEDAIKRALTIDPKTPDARGVLAEISRARGNWDQALTLYLQAIQDNPNKIENHMALSAIYEKQGNWEEAKRAGERAHALDPASPFIANNLAYLYLEHGGDIRQALSLAKQAKQKLPDSPIVSDTVGWAYYKLNAPDDAVSALNESVQRAPANPVYRYHLGMAYIAAGRLDDGARSLRASLATNSDFPYAAKAKTALQQLTPHAR